VNRCPWKAEVEEWETEGSHPLEKKQRNNLDTEESLEEGLKEDFR